MATQVGDLKTALVFPGDVRTATTRIQAQCHTLRSQLLASATVLDPPAPSFPEQVRRLGGASCSR